MIFLFGGAGFGAPRVIVIGVQDLMPHLHDLRSCQQRCREWRENSGHRKCVVACHIGRHRHNHDQHHGERRPPTPAAVEGRPTISIDVAPLRFSESPVIRHGYIIAGYRAVAPLAANLDI